VRGPYHRLLVRWILEELARQDVTQDSLGAVVDMHQTTIGGILRKDKGTFDLDEADLALRHLGSSLKAFIADPANAVVRPPASVSAVAAELKETLRGLTDAQLQVILDVAKAVRARVRRTKRQSARRRDVDQSRRGNSIGGKR